MKFIITKTSIWDEEKPVENCEKVIVPLWNIRTVTEEEFDKKFGASEGLWRSKGTNHQITEQGYVARINGTEEVFIIEINTLDELLEFCETEGQLIISGVDMNKYPSIEIYDDYRE